jgi:hypothetical protein
MLRKPLTCEGTVQYTIVFESKDQSGARLAQASNALEALTVVELLQRGAEEIKLIRSRQEGEIGVEMLRLLAKEEKEELAGGDAVLTNRKNWIGLRSTLARQSLPR